MPVISKPEFVDSGSPPETFSDTLTVRCGSSHLSCQVVPRNALQQHSIVVYRLDIFAFQAVAHLR